MASSFSFAIVTNMNIDNKEKNIINNGLISSAINIAHITHRGQVDKQGNEYINHPLEVAKMLEIFGNRAYMAGLLHDVVEDSSYTAQDLLSANIPYSVVKAVNAVSRPEDRSLSYMEWIVSIKNTSWEEDDFLSHQELENAGLNTNDSIPLAVIVKLADNYHNSLSSRSKNLPEGMKKRYSRARKVLEKGIPDNVIEILRSKIPV